MVGQSPSGEVVRQCSRPLEGTHVVVVVEVGRGDQVDGLEGLVEAVGRLVVEAVVRQSPSLVQRGGRAGGTRLFESK